jgi:iron complex transport system substrate-binding protein
LFLAVFPFLAGALGARAAPAVIDDAGTLISLEQPAKRVIALYGAFNEILAAMGLEDRIVARTRIDRLPPSIVDKPSIGTHMRPNIEMVLGLDPDLVLQMSGRKEASQAVATLRRHGLSTAFFKATSFVELYSVIQRLGVLMGAEPAASNLIESMKSRLARVHKGSVSDSDRPKVFFEVRYPNLLAAGQGSIVSDVIRRAGGVNCVTSEKKLTRLSEEELLRLDPDVYILQKGPMNPNPVALSERSHFRTLKAVRDDRVLIVNEKIFSRPGPRNVDAVETLAALLRGEKP